MNTDPSIEKLRELGFPNAKEIPQPSEQQLTEGVLPNSSDSESSTDGEAPLSVRQGRPATGPYSARKAAQERWRAKNQEKVKGYQKKWREKHAVPLKEAQKAYRERNPEKVKEWQKKSRLRRRARDQARNNQR
jgi:hypothetical protein